MPNREITGLIKKEIALNAATIATDTTTVGNAIGTKGYDGGVNFSIFSGAYTDGTYTPILTECATEGGSYTAVADIDLVKDDETSSTGAEAQAVITSANAVFKLGYKGILPFVKLTIVSTSTSSGALIGAHVEKKPNIVDAV